MKTLVVYYSRTGNTRGVAQKVSEKIGADLLELKDKKKRSGITGFVLGIKDSIMKSAAELEGFDVDLSPYDLIVIGTPVWALGMTPAVRTFLTQKSLAGKKVALFCTTFSDMEKPLQDMKELAQGAQLIYSFGLAAKDLRNPVAVDNKIEELTRKVSV